MGTIIEANGKLDKEINERINTIVGRQYFWGERRTEKCYMNTNHGF